MKTAANTSPFLEKYGPWAVITGASEGIGKAFAEQLARKGMHLVLVARREDLLFELAEELTAKFSINTEVVAADLVTRLGNERLMAQIDELDVGLLVAAAGFGTSGSFIDSDIEEEIALNRLNCQSVVALSHHCIQRFKHRDSSGLILLSSIVAFQGVPHAANYAASKAYIQSLAEGLHTELNPLGIDVIASAPGPVKSGFALRANMQMGMAQTPDEVAQGTLSALGKQRTIRPGILAKFLGYSLSMLPRWGRIHIMTLIMKGMTKHQQIKSTQKVC